MYRLGIDTGGTNTDVVLTDVDTGRMYYAKTPTTPKALMDGIMNGINKIVKASGLRNEEIDELVYGTTIVVNMIAQKENEATALITTRGFKDVLEIGRAYRKENIYDIQMESPEPLVKRNLRFEISGRMNFQGKETEPLKLEEIPAIVEELRAKNIKSVGICLMHSYANPEHEQAVKEALKQAWPEGYVSASSDINPQFREYERTSTTVINAYMMPNMASHIVDFKQHMDEANIGADLYMMQSNAGVMTFDVATYKPVAVADSGPIAGIIAANYLAKMMGEKNIITFDIGGTSTDVALIQDNVIKFTTESHIEGYPISVPSVDLSFIGAGGGSIAYVDLGGALKVGPVSAGADPGPVCYGRGGMHAGAIAEELEMEKVIVPYSPGTFSAMGLVLSDIKADHVHTKLLTREQVNPDVLNEIYTKLDARGIASLEEQDVPEQDRLLVRTCDMRYFGQAFEISVPMPAGEVTEQVIEDLVEGFHEMHRQAYGHCMKEDPIEFVNYRVSAIGSFVKPDVIGSASAAKREKSDKQMYGTAVFKGVEHTVPIYERDTLAVGEIIQGPAVIGEMGATVVVYPGHHAQVDAMQNIIMYTNVNKK